MGTMKSLWTLPKELWLETAMNLKKEGLELNLRDLVLYQDLMMKHK
jgi:hypothetical protein